jgi:hypothetical protein
MKLLRVFSDRLKTYKKEANMNFPYYFALQRVHTVSRGNFQSVRRLPAAWGNRDFIGWVADIKVVSQQQSFIIDTLVPSVPRAAFCRYVEHVPEIGRCRCGGSLCRSGQKHAFDAPSFDNATTTLSCLTTDCDMTAVDKRIEDSGRCR